MYTYELIERGSQYSLDYRIFFKGPNGFLSPWHDIPLFADEEKKFYNMLVEIPRWTNAKMEISVKEPLNPIKQDIKKGQPYFVPNLFPYSGYIWNYGCLPQTWDYPIESQQGGNPKRGSDPIDVMEIGSKIHKIGEIVPVKIICALAVLNEGVIDWKLLSIAVNDELASRVNNIDDIEKYFPGLLEVATYFAYRNYKLLKNKNPNEFGCGGNFKDHDCAHKIIATAHRLWRDLIESEQSVNNLNTECHVEGAANRADTNEWESYVHAQPEHKEPTRIPEHVDHWNYL